MADRVIDVSVNPFTIEMRDGPYYNSGEKENLIKSGVWDKAFTPAELVKNMDDAGIDVAIITASKRAQWHVPFEVVAEILSAAPGRLFGYAGIDPTDITKGVQELERGINEFGFVGAQSYPHWYGITPDDRRYYPFYAKCVELGVPIQIQTGKALQSWNRTVAAPSAIDTISVEFPELRVIATHTGHPWERELVSVAQKNPNVYIAATHYHPTRWAPELVSFIQNEGQQQVIWGTNHPSLDFADALAGIDALGFDDATKRALLQENAERLYNLS